MTLQGNFKNIFRVVLQNIPANANSGFLKLVSALFKYPL